jgi:two-component system response regulator AlgR
LQVLVVDGPASARLHWRRLFEQCPAPSAWVAADATDAVQAMEWLQRRPFDLVMVDVGRLGDRGFALVRALRERSQPPPVVLVSHEASHAVRAFDLEVADFLARPVLPARLQQALRRAQALRHVLGATPAACTLLIPQRDQVVRLPVHEVVYFKAEMKYITARTSRSTYLFEGSLADLEVRHAGQFLRVHRNALAALHWVRALELTHGGRAIGERWQLRLEGVQETLAVSRRQLAAVRAHLKSLA